MSPPFGLLRPTAWRLRSRRPAGATQVWSIGPFAGPSPMALRPLSPAPVLTAADVTDVPALFVADPFIERTDDGWRMYFEVMVASAERGHIATALSPDGRQWAYDGPALIEAFHLSYPHVFHNDGETWMLPETLEAGEVRLYRRVPGCGWRFEQALLPLRLADPTPFQHDGRWWLLGQTRSRGENALRLFHAPALQGPWAEHPQSPLRTRDFTRVRPAGRVVELDGRPVRFAQRTRPHYGMDVRAFGIEELTQATYRERQLGRGAILTRGPEPWRSGGIHHVDAHRLEDGAWFAVADGWRWG